MVLLQICHFSQIAQKLAGQNRFYKYPFDWLRKSYIIQKSVVAE